MTIKLGRDAQVASDSLAALRRARAEAESAGAENAGLLAEAARRAVAAEEAYGRAHESVGDGLARWVRNAINPRFAELAGAEARAAEELDGANTNLVALRARQDTLNASRRAIDAQILASEIEAALAAGPSGPLGQTSAEWRELLETATPGEKVARVARLEAELATQGRLLRDFCQRAADLGCGWDARVDPGHRIATKVAELAADHRGKVLLVGDPFVPDSEHTRALRDVLEGGVRRISHEGRIQGATWTRTVQRSPDGLPINLRHEGWSNGQTWSERYAWNADAQLAEVRHEGWCNGQTWTERYSYDAEGRLARIEHRGYTAGQSYVRRIG